jgi:hypothetical protein
LTFSERTGPMMKDVDGSEADLAEDENGDKYSESTWE